MWRCLVGAGGADGSDGLNEGAQADCGKSSEFVAVEGGEG